MSMTSDNAIAKILRAIKQCGGIASATDIRRSVAEFNRSGGAERLKKFLADLVAKGILLLQKNKANNGQIVESYSLVNSHTCNENSTNNGSSNSSGNLSIAVTLDITLDRLMEIVHSWLNVDDGKDNDDNDSHDNTEEGYEESDTIPFDDIPDDDPSDLDEGYDSEDDDVPF